VAEESMEASAEASAAAPAEAPAEAPAAAPARLPPPKPPRPASGNGNWRKVASDDGTPYFYDEMTRETAWDPPPGWTD
jgi:hypothetical protein